MELEPLLRAARDGEPGAWKLLTPLLYQSLTCYFAREFGKAETIELSQRTVAAVVHQLPGFVPRESLQKWVFGIARNQARDEHRARKKRARLHQIATQLIRSRTSVTARVYDNQLKTILLQEIEQLPPHYRRVIEHELDGGDIESFAEREGIPPNTARTRHHRALDRLRRRLAARLAARPKSASKDSATPSSPANA